MQTQEMTMSVDVEGPAMVPKKVSKGPVYETGPTTSRLLLKDLLTHPGQLQEREPVVVTERMAGPSVRVLWHEGFDGEHRLYVGDRDRWHEHSPGEGFWQVLDYCPGIAELARHFRGEVLFGVLLGEQEGWGYGLNPKKRGFAACGLYHNKRGHRNYEEWTAICDTYKVLRVPELYRGPYYWPVVEGLNTGKTRWPGGHHQRAGCVVQPLEERLDPKTGRVAFQLLSAPYLEGHGE